MKLTWLDPEVNYAKAEHLLISGVQTFSVARTCLIAFTGLCCQCWFQDLVLTRLSCLARAQDEKDYLLLRTSWDALKARDAWQFHIVHLYKCYSLILRSGSGMIYRCVHPSRGWDWDILNNQLVITGGVTWASLQPWMPYFWSTWSRVYDSSLRPGKCFRLLSMFPSCPP